MQRVQDPKNLGKPDPETGLRAKGWNKAKLKEMEKFFEKLSYDQIITLLEIFQIGFMEPIEKISKDEILFIIADDWTYDQILEEVNDLKSQ